MNTTESLRQRALSKRVGTASAALAEMIRRSNFALSEEELSKIDVRGEDVLLGWTFAYRVCRTGSTKQLEMLRAGIHSPNARVREQACDLIGDRRVVDMKGELLALFSDPEPFVAEAAQYNHAMLAV